MRAATTMQDRRPVSDRHSDGAARVVLAIAGAPPERLPVCDRRIYLAGGIAARHVHGNSALHHVWQPIVNRRAVNVFLAWHRG